MVCPICRRSPQSCLCRRQVELLTDALRECWFWQSARKSAIRIRRHNRLQQLFGCYDINPGEAVKVPTAWIS